MNTKKLIRNIEKERYNKKALCEMLKLSRPTLDSRLAGKSDFTLDEINILRTKLGLNNDEINDIFFKGKPYKVLF